MKNNDAKNKVVLCSICSLCANTCKIYAIPQAVVFCGKHKRAETKGKKINLIS
jgi:MinD superfamily P-loop ATPase